MEVAAFVDESFDSFFDLSRDDGYFCMGVAIIPVAELSAFEGHFLTYRQALARAKGFDDDGRIDPLPKMIAEIRKIDLYDFL